GLHDDRRFLDRPAGVLLLQRRRPARRPSRESHFAGDPAPFLRAYATPFTMAATMKKMRRFSTSCGRTGIVAGEIGGGGGTVSDIRDGYILSAKSLTTGRRKRCPLMPLTMATT